MQFATALVLKRIIVHAPIMRDDHLRVCLSNGYNGRIFSRRFQSEILGNRNARITKEAAKFGRGNGVQQDVIPAMIAERGGNSSRRSSRKSTRQLASDLGAKPLANSMVHCCLPIQQITLRTADPDATARVELRVLRSLEPLDRVPRSMGTRRTDRIDRGLCPRGLCNHIASMHVADGHCVVCAAKAETGGDGPCAQNDCVGTRS